MRVIKATKARGLCEALVSPPADPENSRSWRHRVWKAERAKRDPCICAGPTAYRLDGVPMCLNHAGQAALAHLLKVSR